MRKKAKRLRGSGSHGRGYKSSKVKGGVGRAGYKTHKRFSFIVEQKKKIENLKVTCIRDIESKLERLIEKKFIRIRHKASELGAQPHYYFTNKFSQKYKKILSQGEPSGVYHLPKKVKISKTGEKKTQ